MTYNQELKILILMAYYNRPILLKNALMSVLKANNHYQNWELLFGDDGSSVPGKPIVEEVLGNLTEKVKFVNSNLTLEEKLEHGLSIGKFANQALKETDADIAFILCDDDELVPTYLYNLNRFFIQNPKVLYAYSKVHLYNPLIQKSSDVNNTSSKYNQYDGPINPVGKVDASQVAWRLSCCKEYGAWFAESTKFIYDKPWIKDTDRSFFENLFDCCGLCSPTGLIGQYKGIHDYQLLWHKNLQSHELQTYDKVCQELAGRKF